MMVSATSYNQVFNQLLGASFGSYDCRSGEGVWGGAAIPGQDSCLEIPWPLIQDPGSKAILQNSGSNGHNQDPRSKIFNHI